MCLWQIDIPFPLVTATYGRITGLRSFSYHGVFSTLRPVAITGLTTGGWCAEVDEGEVDTLARVGKDDPRAVPTGRRAAAEDRRASDDALGVSWYGDDAVGLTGVVVMTTR